MAAVDGSAAGPSRWPTRGAAPATSLPNVEVWGHDGRRYRFLDDLVRGKVVTFNVMFTSCGDTCPLVTTNLRQVQDLLGVRVGRDIFMHSITLTPELETPEILRDYAERHEIGPGWLFLTGRPADVDVVRQALGFRSADPALDVIADEHTGLLRYGSEPLDRWASCPALLPPASIVKAISGSVLPA